MNVDRERYVIQLRAAHVSEQSAQRQATRVYGPPARDDRREKAIEQDGDDMMQKAGFTVVRLSQARKTRQTPGIPDRRYYRRPRVVERNGASYLQPALVVWWEAKSSSGKQRPGQKLFQELAEACGEAYVLGGLDALQTWLARVLP